MVFFRDYMRWNFLPFLKWGRVLHQNGTGAVVERMKCYCRVLPCGRNASRLYSPTWEIPQTKIEAWNGSDRVCPVGSHHFSRLNQLDKDKHQPAQYRDQHQFQPQKSSLPIKLSPKFLKHTPSPSLPATTARTTTTIPKQPNTLLQRQSHTSRSHRRWIKHVWTWLDQRFIV